MKQSTSFAQVATNQFDYLSSALCANPPSCKKHSSSRKFLTLSISLRLLLVMFLTLTVSAEVWGADVTVKWTASSGALGSKIGSGTIKTGTFSWDYTRTLKSGETYTGWTSSCIQLGKNGGVENITFTTSAIPGTIKSVSVECSSYNNAHKVSIKVGNNTYLSSTATAKWTTISTKTGSGTSSGQIVISFTDGSRALYIKSISVTYEEAAATVPVTGVNLNKSTLTLTEGSFETLIATVSPNNATDQTITWSTSNANFATVSNGKVTAVAEGSATITVKTTDGNKTATCKVTVNPKPTYTVNWYVNGTKADSQTGVAGTTLTSIPNLKDYECGGKVFVGWTTHSSYEHATDAPNDLITNTTGMTIPENGEDYYAVFAESGGTPTTTWPKTDIANIKSTDEVVITMSKGVTTWALRNDYGTSNAPYAESITITNEQISSEVGDVQIWNISNSGGNLTIYPKGKTTTWLYCTNANDGVRVGTNVNKTFTISGNYLKNTVTSRYVGVYMTKPDWRCYTSTTGNSNIAGQTLAFYKKTTTSGYQNYTTECSTPTEFTVSFDANGHGTAPTAQTVESGQKATEPTAPTAIGYTFGGWYKEPECQNVFDFNTAITADITLYAKWTAIQTTITLNANGGSGNTISVAATYDSSTLNPSSITNPTQTGHTFGGWYSGEGGTGSLVINSSGKLQANVSGFTGTNGVWKATTDKTLYAKWTPAVYAINYKDQGGAKLSGQHEAGYPQNHTYNTETTLKSASKNHYTFDGWYKESDCSGTKVTTLGAKEYTDNITLYAQWTAKTYTITLDAGTGECDTESVTTTNASGVTLPTASHTCTDWTFAGWWTEEVGATTTSPGELLTAGSNYKPTSDCTLYAVYSYTEAGGGGSGFYLSVTKGAATYYIGEKGSGSFLSAVTDVNSAATFNIENNQYLYYGNKTYVSSTSDNTSLTIATTTPSATWAITDDGETITFKSNGTGGRYLAFNYNNGSPRFSSYGSTYTYELTKHTTSTTTYNSNPTCLVPVWNGATIDKTALTVNCGERSSMDGAAKITFSKDEIFGFSNPITIEASEGFLVSTSRTPNGNYQQSVSQSPLIGTDYPNTFNGKFVYVRAEAPAQSDTDLSGTITIKNNKGETLQTFSVTADVTCTTYTLTLNDRGTKTTAEYYAGASVPKPADPEGVCTDPINYVFDGWSLDPVTDENTTSYEKVTFPFDMPAGKTTLYAVYRYVEDGSADSGDYVKLTEDLDDYSGDYLIVYETGKVAFDGGRNNVDDELDATSNTIEVTINDNTIASNATTDAAKFTIAKVDGGYSIQSASGYYIGRSATSNGLSTNETYSANYDLNTITDCKTIKGKGGNILKYNKAADQKRFRYYQSGQETIALYRKAASYLYTTSPVCGPHVEITSDKDIYITSGFANGRNTVIAQKKITFAATRLKPSAGGAAPSIKVPAADITLNGSKTDKVKIVDITQNIVLQDDGITYAGTGEITVSYTPTASDIYEDINVQLRAEHNTGSDVSLDAFTVHARSLPEEFIIVAKQGDKWYALNGDMSGSKAQPANGQVVLDNTNEPTKATYAPCNTIYTFNGMPDGSDKSFVRFIGLERKHLWAASAGNTGIQNNAKNPTGDATAYNWTLYTADNAIYQLGNKQNGRLLGLNAEKKFGMYASGVQDIRILPYETKCLYNYAPSNLKVSVLKGTCVTLTWDTVAGATKYQYSTDGTTWTDAGTEPTVTINGLTGATKYTYYIRAYHEDADVTNECIDYAEITFTTADCDDVPTDISFAAGIYSITLYWQCAAEKSTVILYSDEAGTQAIKTITDAKSPLTIDDLDKVTTYYAKILAGGICASPLTTVSTAPPAVDVVEWKTDGMDVYVNTDDEIIVSLEGEVHEGSGSGNVATELFFSKYFEATGNVKLLALFNGTGQDIDLSTYSIKFSAKGADYTGATTTEEVKYDNTIELSEDIPDDRLILPAGKELIMISYPTSGAAGAVSITNPDGTTIKIDSKDAAILECAANNSQESGWDDYVRVTSPLLNFSGNDAVALFKGDQLVDIIGAGNTTNVNMSKVVAASTNPSFMDAAGWYNANGYQIQPDGTIGTTNNYPLSTNRCLLIRRNTVINGDNAVLKNTTDFVTLGGQESEWMGYQIPDGNGACEGFEYVGKYDYANYYTTYDKVGEDQTFESGSRNPDGTVPVSIPEIGKYSCKNLKITVKDEEQVLVVQEFKVPIIVAKNQNTDGEVFTALKTTLGTVVIDQNGTPTGEIEPLTDEEWIEECKECDIVVRDNATLTHVTTGLDQFRDLTIYPTGKLSNIESNLAVNRLMIQAENDQVGYAIIEKGEGSITANAIAHTKRIDAQYWYAFSLPYDCNINEITQANGESMGEYGVHWGIQYYDGKRRQYEGTSANLGQSSKFWLPMGPNDKLNAYQGYLIALFDASVQKPTDMRTIYFPPAEENTYTESGSDSKQTNVYSWNVNLTCEKRHHGWNFTGTPYISMFNPVAAGITDADLSNVLMTGTWDPVENEYEENEHVYVSIPTPNGGKYYNQHLASTKELLPFMAYFVQTSDPTTDDETKQLTYAKGGRELPAAAPARAAATAQRVLVELLVTAPDGQTDNTGVWVDENYVPEYELAADLTKMYVAGEKPQLYTLAANNEKMAYNALPDGAATNIPLGLYAPIAGDYNLSLNERMSRIAGAESVELIYNNAVVANLLFQDYTITAKKGNVNGYSLCIRRRANVTTAVDNVTGSVITMIVNDGYISVLGVPTDATVYVYDMVGHLMEMQSANGNTVVNMPSVPQGVYNIVITNDKGSTTIKSFVK